MQQTVQEPQSHPQPPLPPVLEQTDLQKSLGKQLLHPNKIFITLDAQETFFNLKPDEGIFNNLFTQSGLTSPFSAYNIKTKLKVKAQQLVQKIVAKVRQAEQKLPTGNQI